MEQVRAIMAAADETNSPVILQGSAGARKYAGEAFLRHLIAAAVETWPHIPEVMHPDHGASPSVCIAAIRSGFTSVMMDGRSEERGVGQECASTCRERWARSKSNKKNTEHQKVST